MSEPTLPRAADTAVDWRLRSFPFSAAPRSAAEAGAAGWQLQRDFATPVAALKESALRHNLARMRDHCTAHGIQIAPHGKTTMSPELVRRQLDHGAWGMTAANALQARAMLAFGARRVIIANECLDPAGLRWAAEHMAERPEIEIYAFVDSVDAVKHIRSALQEPHRGDAPEPHRPARPLPLLVEVGVPGGRAGVRDAATAVEVGLAVAQAPELELAGVAGFEGVVGGVRTPQVVQGVRQFLAAMRDAAEALLARRAFPPERRVILSAGGSAFFDQVIDVLAPALSGAPQAEVVIRSGCYVVHDHGLYADASPFAGDPEGDFRPALEVWARVLSVPEDGLAVIDAGRRDMSTDAQLPTVLCRERAGERTAVTGLAVQKVYDQHSLVPLAGHQRGLLRVGDLVALGISHPCTTFDKWRALPVVDDGYQVTSVVRTFF